MDSLCVVVLVLSMGVSRAANIAMMPMFGRSHYLVMAKLADELASRGHQVAIFVGQEGDYALGKPYVKPFYLPQEARSQNLNLVRAMTGSKADQSGPMNIQRFFDIQKTYCEYFFSSTSTMDEVRRADVLIGDSIYLCSSLVADRFDIPHIVINMSPINPPTLEVFGVTSDPAYISQLYSGLPIHMNLKERIKNVGHFLMRRFGLYYLVYPTFDSVKVKYNISPQKSIAESLATVDLILMASDLTITHAQPNPPFVKDVGFFLPSPPKPLPTELEEFMQESGEEGVILMSFGSMVDTLDENTTKVMLKAFARMPQKVLAKLNPGNLPKGSIPTNVKTVKWLPQNDILGHKKTKLFVTHAGANGLAEAAYHSVPMLCSPFFADQFDNSQLAKDTGIAEILRVTSSTVDELVNVMTSLIEDPRYREKSARVSKAMRLRARTPVQEAAELVEYVQAQGHLDHLKPRSLSLPFYQVYMLDVLAVMATAMVIVLVLLVSVARLVIRSCSKKKDKIA